MDLNKLQDYDIFGLYSLLGDIPRTVKQFVKTSREPKVKVQASLFTETDRAWFIMYNNVLEWLPKKAARVVESKDHEITLLANKKVWSSKFGQAQAVATC